MEQPIIAEAALSPGWQVIAAIVVFLAVYAIVITDRLSRTVFALAGAVVILLLGIVGLEEAYRHHIEWRMIFLLIGMMLLTGTVNKSGLFQYAAVKAVQRAKGDPVIVLIALALLTAAGSALLDSVMTVLLIVPVTLSITRVLGVNPTPYLIAEIIAANVGGTATLIGGLPNMMIGSANPHLTFNDFLIAAAPASILVLAASLGLLVLLYRRKLTADAHKRRELMKMKAGDAVADPALLRKSLYVLGLTLAGFLLHGPLSTWTGVRIEAAVIAIAGALLLMLTGLKGDAVEEAIDGVEWKTIVFFAGLFILVGGLAETGVIGRLATRLMELTSGDLTYLSLLMLWVSGIVSATVDNTPFVAAVIPLLQDVGLQMDAAAPEALNPVWWSLALGSGFGGGGTLIGASINVIAAGLAARDGVRISYMEFLKIGGPLTLLSLLLSTLYVYVFLL